MTELKNNKFEVIGLLHFQNDMLPSHMAKRPFQKRQYVLKDTREKD